MFFAFLLHHLLNRGWTKRLFQEVFAFLPIRQGMALGRTVHLLCSYWGYLLLSLHLGLHWGMMVAMAGKKLSPSPRRRVVFNILGAAAALYGVFALFQRQTPTYLFLASDLSRGLFSFRDKICPHPSDNHSNLATLPNRLARPKCRPMPGG